MEIINNTKNNIVNIDKVKEGELFLFNGKLYIKIADNAQYYLTFLNPKSYPISEAIDCVYQRIEEWDEKKDLSSIPHDYIYNAFNLTDNDLAYVEYAFVTLVKGTLTIENA